MENSHAALDRTPAINFDAAKPEANNLSFHNVMADATVKPSNSPSDSSVAEKSASTNGGAKDHKAQEKVEAAAKAHSAGEHGLHNLTLTHKGKEIHAAGEHSAAKTEPGHKTEKEGAKPVEKHEATGKESGKEPVKAEGSKPVEKHETTGKESGKEPEKKAANEPVKETDRAPAKESGKAPDKSSSKDSGKDSLPPLTIQDKPKG